MCEICDGSSYEDMFERCDHRIATHGWFVQGVSGEAPWVYTVGLQESISHPELVLVDVEPELGTQMLNRLGDAIVAGEVFRAGETCDLGELRLAFRAVTPERLQDGLCAMWTHFYRWRGDPPGLIAAIEVVSREPDAPWRTRRTTRATTRHHGPNRAERRRAARRRR